MFARQSSGERHLIIHRYKYIVNCYIGTLNCQLFSFEMSLVRINHFAKALSLHVFSTTNALKVTKTHSSDQSLLRVDSNPYCLLNKLLPVLLHFFNQNLGPCLLSRCTSENISSVSRTVSVEGKAILPASPRGNGN